MSISLERANDMLSAILQSDPFHEHTCDSMNVLFCTFLAQKDMSRVEKNVFGAVCSCLEHRHVFSHRIVGGDPGAPVDERVFGKK